MSLSPGPCFFISWLIAGVAGAEEEGPSRSLLLLVFTCRGRKLWGFLFSAAICRWLLAAVTRPWESLPMLRCEEVKTRVMKTKAHCKKFFSGNFSLKVRKEQLQPRIHSNHPGASYLIHICEIYSLAQLVQLSLVWDRHLSSVFDMREGVRSACSPAASSRGGLR